MNIETPDNAAVVKAAAKRMCEQLGAKGVQVKHSQMLEALAMGLGIDSWRKLKAVIDAPRAPRASSKPAEPTRREPLPLTGEYVRWTVGAMYLDNHQQYGDYYQARTPLEAAVCCLVERLTDCGNEVGVLDVSDERGVTYLSPSMLDEIRLMTNHRALAQLLQAAQALRTEAGPSEAADLQIAWLRYVLADQGLEGCEALTDWVAAEQASTAAADTFVEGQELTPVQVLQVLCDQVEAYAGGVFRLEQDNEGLALALYQVRAICDYFGEVLNDASAHPFAGVSQTDLA